MSRIYIPVDLTSRANIDETLGYAKTFQDKGFETGLMCLMRGGVSSLTDKSRQSQYQNFQAAVGNAHTVPVIVMASCLPLSDLDFFHIPEKSMTHIKAAIDFADELPGRGEYPLVTFHLNTLLTPEGYDPAEDYEKIFDEKILPHLKPLAAYGERKHIGLKIETTPVPEFGDLDNPNLNTLINPYPIYSKYFQKIRNTSMGIALDLCHTYALLKKLALPRTLMDEVRMLADGDVVHLNDSKDLFLPEKNLLHKENVTLGEGEIDELPQIIRYSMGRNWHIVFEINDAAYEKGTRPNLEKSMQYYLKII